MAEEDILHWLDQLISLVGAEDEMLSLLHDVFHNIRPCIDCRQRPAQLFIATHDNESLKGAFLCVRCAPGRLREIASITAKIVRSHDDAARQAAEKNSDACMKKVIDNNRN
jgi:hypothetical protein